MLFPERLRRLRMESGLKQKDIAKKIGVDIPMYSRYEHGERRPKRAQVVKLAKIFKTDSDELVAQWLAYAAINEVGTDKMASKAIPYLLEELGGGEIIAPEATPVEKAPVEAAPKFKVEIPFVEPSQRTVVKELGDSPFPKYYQAKALDVLSHIEDDSIDCIMTCPPYWNLRRYDTESIDTDNFDEFVEGIVAVTKELFRVLKPSGSLWLNMADTYHNKSLRGLPWRVAIRMIDEQGWTMRNDVVWDKQNSAFDSSSERLRNVHEFIFHFVKGEDYYYDDEEMRLYYNNLTEKKAKEGKSNSGVTGARYRKNIQSSKALTDEEKANALAELDKAVAMVTSGEIPDFRFFIREQKDQVIESRSEKAKSINEKGYYVLLYNKNGTMPSDVWSLPVGNSPIERYNVFSESLCNMIILTTCPDNGIVLDPYCGMGTACKVAYDLHRRAIGIDVNGEYIKQARAKIQQQPLSLF